MLVNTDQVLNYFNDPDNVHKLYVYEIVNFDNNIESVVSENTNNFLKIKHFKTCLGIFESAKFSPQIKILSQNQQDIGIRINTDYIFLTNDNMGFLEKTKKTFVFTVQEPFNKESIVYFLGDGSLKCINDLNSDDTDLKLDDDNLINLYSIALQPIAKLEIGKNSNINFVLVGDFPEMKKIDSLTYTIPLESIYQTIQVIGSIKNDLLDLEIKNEKLELEMVSKNGIVPLIVNFENLNQKAEIKIFNFILEKQIPLFIANKFINNKSLDLTSAFDYISSGTSTISNDALNDLKVLLKKIIVISNAYNKNFDFMDKTNKSFVDYYNMFYQPKTCLEFNAMLIYDYQTKYPDAIQTLEFELFKSICFNLSHFVQTPFGFQDYLTNEHKDKLWFWFDLVIDETCKKILKDVNGNLENISNSSLLKITTTVIVSSVYFNFKSSLDHSLILSQEFNLNSIEQSEYLPNIKISNLDNDGLGYKATLFFNNTNCSSEAMSFFSFVETNKEFHKIFTAKSENGYPTVEDVKKLLPFGAQNIVVLNVEHNTIQNTILLECDEWQTFYGNQDLKLFKCDAVSCYYTYPEFVATGEEPPQGFIITERPKKTITTYITNVEFKYELNSQFVAKEYNTNSSKLFKFLLNKNNSKPTNEITFKLKKEWEQQGWYINDIKEDYHYSLLNCATKAKINYFDKNNELKEYIFEIKNSFQKIDNTNVLTKNRY